MSDYSLLAFWKIHSYLDREMFVLVCPICVAPTSWRGIGIPTRDGLSARKYPIDWIAPGVVVCDLCKWSGIDEDEL